jgi:hypothetical protein
MIRPQTLDRRRGRELLKFVQQIAIKRKSSMRGCVNVAHYEEDTDN